MLEEEENSKPRKKSSNVQEVEELNFLLKSGIVLCKLIKKIYPKCGIDVESLQVEFKPYSKESFFIILILDREPQH